MPIILGAKASRSYGTLSTCSTAIEVNTYLPVHEAQRSWSSASAPVAICERLDRADTLDAANAKFKAESITWNIRRMLPTYNFGLSVARGARGYEVHSRGNGHAKRDCGFSICLDRRPCIGSDAAHTSICGCDKPDDILCRCNQRSVLVTRRPIAPALATLAPRICLLL
jgi:hypothetical protein